MKLLAKQDGGGQRPSREQTIAAAITLDLQTKDSVRGEQHHRHQTPPMETCHGIDLDHRRVSAAIWRRRILGPQPRSLVTERVAPLRGEQALPGSRLKKVTLTKTKALPSL